MFAFACKVVVLVKCQKRRLAEVLLQFDESLFGIQLDSLIEDAAKPHRQLDVAELLAFRFGFNFLFI